MDYLYILQQALSGIITIFWIYNIAISVCALIKFKEKPLLTNKQHKFMAIIPAHNEEKVVKNLIESLKEQNYPKELLDIYVIADNCTDNTANIAKNAGAIVYERNDPEHKTKGYAMQWFLNKMQEQNAEYDALCVFDADNVVDKEFMNAMNKKLCQGEEVVQGYRDTVTEDDGDEKYSPIKEINDTTLKYMLEHIKQIRGLSENIKNAQITKDYFKDIKLTIKRGAAGSEIVSMYATGGLADFTGPAWLDGTKSRPELVLNARDTENFIQLKDILGNLLRGNMLNASTNSGDNYYEVHIEVDKLESDYDVEQVADKVKRMINSDARYRNVNSINKLR